jgi:hypothetical protein
LVRQVLVTGCVVCAYFLLLMRRARREGGAAGGIRHGGKPVLQALVKTMFEHDDLEEAAEEEDPADAAVRKSDKAERLGEAGSAFAAVAAAAAAKASADAAAMPLPQAVSVDPENGDATGHAHVSLAVGGELRMGAAVARTD